MAYSPSLEAIDALCATKLPIVVMDTTETLTFTNRQDPAEIMFNHGIHGVMDLCSMLTRRGKTYAIAAGHYLESDVIDRVCGYVRAAAAARTLSVSRVELVGGAFEGMGDFRVDYDELKARFGIDVKPADADRIRALYESLTDDEVAAEKAANAARFDRNPNVIEAEYDLSVRSCLALRKYVAEKELSAFSVNFTQVGMESSGLSSVPFIECCKSMEAGIGYAGEGDALTAAFTGAFLAGWPDASFVEIFCPDWKNNILFLSHMGELNYRIAAVKPCIRRAGTKYGPDDVNPYVGYTRMKGGRGVYVNISRARDDFRLFLGACEMQDYDHDRFEGSMRGWMRPLGSTTAQFLEKLSVNGATHHSIFVYGATVEELAYFGRLLKLETVIA
jgi:L-arabinose isomerase